MSLRENVKKLFEPTDNTFIQFIRYIFVGGISFLADAFALWTVSLFAHYLIAAAIAFVFGLIVNFVLSKLFVFTDNKTNKFVEFMTYAVIGVVGLLLTELLMYLLTDKLHIFFMLSKVITAAIVLVWNFAARKIILYRKGNK